MAKVTEYSRITKMKDNDILLVDGPDGTRTILQTDASKQMGGEVIMVNETAGDSTKVVINTTGEDVELATMADLEPVEEDVSELKTQIDDVKSAITQCTGNTQITMTEGAFYRLDGDSITIGSPSTNSGEEYAVVPCAEGDVFTVSGAGGAVAQPWAFTDSSGVILDREGNSSTVTLTKKIVVAPANAAYLILNNAKANQVRSYIGVYLVDRVSQNEGDIDDIDAALYENGIVHISKREIESGTFTANGQSNDKKRLRLIAPFYAGKDTKIRFNIGTWYYCLFELSSNSVAGNNIITNTSWLNDAIYTVQNDCWIYIVFATASSYSASSAITVDDFGAKTVIITPVRDISDSLKYWFVPEIQQGSLVSSGATAGDEVDSSKSIRTGWILSDELMSVSSNGTVSFIPYLYDENKGYVEKGSARTTAVTETAFSLIGNVNNVRYIRLQIFKGSNQDTSVEDFDEYGITIDCVKSQFKALQDEIDSFDDSVDALNARVFVDDLPAYWETYMTTKLPTIQSRIENAALSGDSFIFLTDYHYDPVRPNLGNSGYSHLLVKQIIEKSSLRMFVFGGDATNESDVRDTAVAWMRDVSNRLHSAGGQLFGLRGNHEYNLNAGSEALELTDTEIYSWFIKSSERNIVLSGLGLDYYVDNDEQKIRYIMMDAKYERTGGMAPIISDDQITWMQARMTELDSTWSIVVLTHQLFGINPDPYSAVTETTYNSSGTKIHNGVVAVLQDLSATLIAVICGHCHYDYSTDESGFWEISTTTDSHQELGEWGRHTGDYREQAFDVYSIDKANNKLYATRIGRGVDREWSY